MTDDEVETVAVEVAKAGGVSWHSGQERGPLKLVMDRFRDRARLAITTLDRVRAAKQAYSPDPTAIEPGRWHLQAGLDRVSHEEVAVGSLILYRPPGDKRTYPCRVRRVEGSRVYLVPEIPACPDWVDLANLSSPAIQ